MTLGDIIKDYRKTHGLSMDNFSEMSGISKAYISLLEKNKHPKTGKPITPSIHCIKQAADGMGIDFNVLFNMIDGNVSLDETNEEREQNFSRRAKHYFEHIAKKNNTNKLNTMYNSDKHFQELCDTYTRLSTNSKRRVCFYAKNILDIEIADYEVNAAHERTDIEVTEEMKNHDEGIMDDDSIWS